MADDTFYGSDFGALQSFDPDIAGVLLSELDRIRSEGGIHRDVVPVDRGILRVADPRQC